MTFMRARYGQHQIDQHAAVERQVANRRWLDYLTDAGVSSSQDVHGFTLNRHSAGE